MIKNITTALAAKRAELGKDDKGFTLIELLVVVLIIGILAAIAIPVFLGQQDQAKDSAVKSDLANAKVAYVSYLVDNPDDTPTLADLEGKGFVESSDGSIAIASTSAGADFCIEGTSTSSSTPTFKITDEKGVETGSCGTTATPTS